MMFQAFTLSKIIVLISTQFSPYIKGVGAENLANMRSHYLEMQPEILEKKGFRRGRDRFSELS